MSDPEILFQGQRFRVERTVQTTPDGSRHVREVVRHPGAVVILPLLDDGRICFVRNFRVAVATNADRAAGRHAGAGRGPCRNRPARTGRRDRLSGGPARRT